MSASNVSKSSTTQTKLEAARAEHAAKTAAAQATAEACRTDESEPDSVHAAAIDTMLDAAPTSWVRRIIGWVSGVIAGSATWYYGAIACNLLLAAVGPGFLGFLAYMLCVIVLFLASVIASWATNALVGGSIKISSVAGMVTGFFKKSPAPAAA